MIINHNMSAEYANRVLKFQNREVNKNIEKLSSGMRINRAGDDASGLAVSEKLRSQIRGLRQAERNIENAVSFIQATSAKLTTSCTASGSWPYSPPTESTPTKTGCRSRLKSPS